jgi:hypothetical protein
LAFYYNPVSGNVTKVSAAEKRAYDEHFREERWTKLLDNETTIPTLVAAFTAIAGTAFAAWLLDIILGYYKEEAGLTLTEEARSAWSNAVYGGKLTVDVISAPLTGRGSETVPLPPGVAAPVSVTYDQLWEYAARKILAIPGVDVRLKK